MSSFEDKLQPVELAPESTALVIVDMENTFCKPGGMIYLGPRAEEVTENIAGLAQRCRDAGAPVIYIRSVRQADNPDYTRFNRGPALLEGTWGPVIVEELTPQPGEAVVEKGTHDCFHETELDATLARMGIKPETHHIIVTGVASGVCVYHAVLGFHVRHYYTVVPMDCTCGGPGEDEFMVTQMSSGAYNYNVTLSSSEKVSFATAPTKA